MIRSDRFWAGRIFNCLWIILLLLTEEVSHGRRYDKCITRDGRQGVCVVKRYCREASHQELLPCERDEENHCCPIPTTQRSAIPPPPPPPPPESPDRTREDDRYRPEEQTKAKRPEVFREPDRDDRLNKTPPPADRRPPTRHENDRHKKRQNPENVEDYEGDRRRTYDDPRGNPKSPPERPRPPTRHEDDRPKKPPNPENVDEYQGERHRPYDDPRDNPPERPRPPTRYENDNDRPKKRPNPENADDYEGNGRRPYDDHRDNPRNPPERPREAPRSRPSSRPTENDRRDPPARRPDPDRFYPANDDLEAARATSPPRRRNHDRVPERRNRTADDSSKAPIRFPETYELSVPRPKVPACGVKPYELFIAGGQESGDHEWPWMTAIFRRYPDSRPKTFLCGGSLINTKYVLTAAHCFVNNYVILPASAFVVRLGSHFLDNGEEYTVSNLVIHHNHSGSDFFNDIALVRLASEVYITDKIAPICLPSPDMIRDNMVGRFATVAGWGDTAFRTSGTRILQHVTVPIVSGEECFAAYSRVRGAAFLARGSDHVICAGLREGGKDACLGDSGGPLMLKMPDDRWIVIGIVSLGYKCAEPGYPGVYTRVTHYMSWINTNMKTY